MSKVHPQRLVSISSGDLSPPSSPSISSEERVYTIWMKSLILGGKGCTVYDSKGHLVYRVDNYHSKSTNKVFLMNSHGKLLCTLLRKRFKLCTQWEGYRGVDHVESKLQKGLVSRPWFRVRKPWKIFSSDSNSVCCKAIVDLDPTRRVSFGIQTDKCRRSLGCKIVDGRGGVVAEVKRKQSEKGVVLGEDVSKMVVADSCLVDHSLIMGLLISYALISSQM